MDIRKLLLVDDDRNIRTIAQIGLEDTPEWTVITAASGQEALDKAKAELPDLILLDVTMPGMDGMATISRLKENSDTKDIPVIFLTAKVLPDELEHFLSLGAIGIIPKPFDPMRLSGEIKQMVGIKRP